jgi:hypothetical protein
VSETLRFDLLANDRASHVFNKVGDSADRTTDRFKNFAKMGAVAAAAGAVLVGKALVDMTKAAMDDQKAQEALATTLKNTTGATDKQVAGVEKWIGAQGKALGVTDDELRPALQRLAEATGDVGKAQDLASLAMDVSAGTGKSLKTVSEALMKAQNGQIAGLSRLGIETKNAAGETLTFEQATKKMGDTFGGQAATAAETAAGKFQRLRVMFDETKESIGAKLIPIASDLATLFITKVVPAAQQLGDWLRTKLGPPLADLAERVGPAANRIMSALSDAFQDARPFINLVGTILSNVVVPALSKLLDVAGPVLAGAIRALGKALEFVGEAGTWMWNNALQPAFHLLVTAIGWVLDGFSSMLDALSNVPGFGWAEKAAVSMGKAADKANAVAAGIVKIPPTKTVTVTVAYVYKGKDPTRSGQGTGGTDSFMPRMADVQKAAIKLGELIPQGFAGGTKAKIKVALAAVNELATRAADRLKSLKDEAASIMSGVASAVTGALDVSGLGSALFSSIPTATDLEKANIGVARAGERVGAVNADPESSALDRQEAAIALREAEASLAEMVTRAAGGNNSATGQLATFAAQAQTFSTALATAAAAGVDSSLIAQVAALGPMQGLDAATALAAMDAAQVASANQSMAAVAASAAALGTTVLTTTSLPEDIARAQGQLDTLLEIRDDLKNNPRNISFTVNDATDPDKVVAAIRRYVTRNGKLRGLTRDD